MIPVTDRHNNIEHWTARSRRIRYLRRRNRSSSSSSASSSNSYAELRIYEGADILYDMNNNDILGQGTSSSSSASSSSSSTSSSSFSSNSHVAADSIDNEEYRIFEGAGSLYDIVEGAKSFNDIRMYQDIQYATYREACQARGLLKDDTEWQQCLTEHYSKCQKNSGCCLR